MFDAVCPLAQSHTLQPLLCIILMIQNSLHLQKYDPKISLRRFIEEYSHYFNNVSFMYIYNDYQPGFILPIKRMILINCRILYV